ncbi:hypothetical protein MTBBW1_420010 [Desulfamplus magnetovallimortis]|uniref:Uncharacterized protein n=1 Tax=Desulfamplus magnetovallimortis TaxID=1246637 RepID=A0A1W1HH53_9BACT|nr:hypothetical protein MTBBW1_420010 [Desulfamplus magnetovallimortis]
MKVFFKTGRYGDFHITNMAVHRHNRSVESLYKNSNLRGLSYKKGSLQTLPYAFIPPFSPCNFSS